MDVLSPVQRLDRATRDPVFTRTLRAAPASAEGPVEERARIAHNCAGPEHGRVTRRITYPSRTRADPKGTSQAMSSTQRLDDEQRAVSACYVTRLQSASGAFV
jgi:hypothetical protein